MVTLLMPSSKVLASTDLLESTRQAIRRGVDFLPHAQQPDGSFPIYRCEDQALTECSPISTTTSTAFVLVGVSAVADPRT